ncbi:MAG TPA: HAMP domain-containing sensor histidine kinase [Candidatus Limnocylindrales bacterium]
MPEGSSVPGGDAPGGAAPAPGLATNEEAVADAALIRQVRWRLVVWSGGSTLLVLVVLGLALYLSVASSLAASSQDVLQDRAASLVSAVKGERPTPGDSFFDFSFGGGTFGIAISPAGDVFGPRGLQLPTGLPDQDAISAASASGQDVRNRTISFPQPGPTDTTSLVGVPVRQLTETVTTDTGTWSVQVVQDRTTEAHTLQNIVIVLSIGGVLVVLVAAGFGWIYARRALVPIRDSLAGQRAALTRQREFAADASHELRTPLTVIRSSVEHLRRHASEPVSQVGDALEDIDAEVEHLTAMVGDLLLLARSDSGAVSLDAVPVELDDVAADAAASLRGPAEARAVSVVVDPEPAPVTGDPARLRQLVTVLIDNAIRHSPASGEVRVAVRHDGDVARLTVEDQGRGIRPEDLPRVFDRFWRAPDAPSGGTGLGLAIARWIAERHGGTITAGNRPDGGARFEVDLPARAAAPRSTNATPS